MKHGIKETMELLVALFAIKLSYEEAKADDGKITWKDSFKFYPAVKKVINGFKGIHLIPDELNDLDNKEIDDIGHAIGVALRCNKPEIEEIKKAITLVNQMKNFILPFVKKN